MQRSGMGGMFFEPAWVSRWGSCASCCCSRCWCRVLCFGVRLRVVRTQWQHLFMRCPACKPAYENMITHKKEVRSSGLKVFKGQGSCTKQGGIVAQ